MTTSFVRLRTSGSEKILPRQASRWHTYMLLKGSINGALERLQTIFASHQDLSSLRSKQIIMPRSMQNYSASAFQQDPVLEHSYVHPIRFINRFEDRRTFDLCSKYAMKRRLR